MAGVVGERWIEEGEFDRLDDPALFGAEFDVYRPEWPFGYEIGLYHHHEEETLPITMRTELRGMELAVGLRKTFELRRLPVRFYLGSGISIFYTDRDNEVSPIVGQEGADVDGGFYARAGLNVFFTDSIFVGFDYRRIAEDIFDYGGYDLDGNLLTIRVGWSF